MGSTDSPGTILQGKLMGQVLCQCRKSSQDQEGMGLGTGSVLGLALGTCAPAEMGLLGDGHGL